MPCCRFETAIGPLTVSWEGERLTGIGLPGHAPSDHEERAPPAWVADLVHGLQRYAAGDAVTFDLARIDFGQFTDFQARVYRALCGVPRGETRGYGELATAAGSPRAARAVGNCMARNPFPIVVPCHRVLAGDGLGGYGGGLDLKRRLLDLESA